jgi:DNA-binding NarL/FixJ family response regulator
MDKRRQAMVNVLILADHTERIRSISSACGVRDADIQLYTAEIDRFDPAVDAAALNCDIVILDHGAPLERRIRLVQEIRELNENARFLVTGIPQVTETQRTDLIFSYVEQGVAGYLGEEVLEQLELAIEELLRGGAWIEPAMTTELVQRTIALREALAMIKPHTYGAGQPDVLTRRQNEVLELLAGGLTNRQIAEELYISIGTVKNHVHRILDVLQASSRDQAAEYFQYLHAPAVAA